MSLLLLFAASRPSSSLALAPQPVFAVAAGGRRAVLAGGGRALTLPSVSRTGAPTK